MHLIKFYPKQIPGLTPLYMIAPLFPFTLPIQKPFNKYIPKNAKVFLILEIVYNFIRYYL
jgi:hypothetical protein